MATASSGVATVSSGIFDPEALYVASLADRGAAAKASLVALPFVPETSTVCQPMSTASRRNAAGFNARAIRPPIIGPSPALTCCDNRTVAVQARTATHQPSAPLCSPRHQQHAQHDASSVINARQDE